VLRPTFTMQQQDHSPSGFGRGKSALDSVKLTALMELTSGLPEIVVALLDGPVVTDHPDLASDHIREVPGRFKSACSHLESAACQHGTFVAGILSAKRSSSAPAICPDCTLLVRSVFPETSFASGEVPSASPQELAEAILDCISAGAHVLNISAAIAQPSTKSERALAQSLDEAARRGAIVVAAAGNQGTLGSTTITSHPWVIPVVAYDSAGRPLLQSNLGGSIGRRGVGAPGDGITSLGVTDKPLTLGGTSAAAPFVAGAVALLWSEFPNVDAAVVKLAIAPDRFRRRPTVVPPLLDAWRAYQSLSTTHARKDRRD
jgi:subtilisin family serine protease